MLDKRSLFAILIVVIAIFAVESKAELRLEAGEISAGNGFKNIISIHWSKHDGGAVSEYHLYRKSVGTEYIPIDTLGSSRIHTTDNNVEAGVTYTYKISALINGSEVPSINESEATCNRNGHLLTIPGFNTSAPTIDGVIEDAEWADAVLIDITNNTSIWTTPLENKTYAAIKYVDGKLYIAVKDFNDTTKDQNDQMHIFFDFNNDNQWTEEDNDGRLLIVWNDIAGLDGSTYTPMSGVYPNPTFGDSYWMYESDFFNGIIEADESGDAVNYEAVIDLNSSSLNFDLDNNNFGMMIQCSRYTADGNSGMTGMFPNNALWGSPATFAETNIQLSEDIEAPQVIALSGNETILNHEMNLELQLSDMSSIATVVGEYTIGGITKQITLNSMKNRFAEKGSDKHIYVFTGLIPAESTNITGIINFNCEDEYGNTEISEDYSIVWTGDATGPEITYLSAPTEQYSNQSVFVRASIIDESSIASATLKYTITGEDEVSIVMENVEGDIYTAEIPGQIENATAVYKIVAIDNSPSSNEIESSEINILWHEYVCEWFGNYDGIKTGGLGYNQDTPWGAGMVLELGDVVGKIDKISYQCNTGTNAPLNWRVYQMVSSDEWTSNIIENGGLLSDDLVVGFDEWTDVEVNGTTELTGTVGFYIELPNGGYIARDGNSTHGISWFHNFDPNVPTTEWRKLGEGELADYPGDWMFRCHIYGSVGIDKEVIPGKSELFGNYPNPFNPTTLINYRNNISGNILLAVYNSRGEIVKQFDSKNQNAGNHSIRFDASSLNGGIYFYSLKVNNRVISTKKMVLVK